MKERRRAVKVERDLGYAFGCSQELVELGVELLGGHDGGLGAAVAIEDGEVVLVGQGTRAHAEDNYLVLLGEVRRRRREEMRREGGAPSLVACRYDQKSRR